MRLRAVAVLGCVLVGGAWVAPPARAGEVALGWDPSPNPNVARYAVHHGPGSRDYDAATWTERAAATVPDVPDCTERYFAVRAYDAEGAPRGGFSREIRGWARPRVDAAYPEVIETGAEAHVYVVGANFRDGATVEFDVDGITVLSAEVLDCRRMVVRFRVAGTAAEGPTSLYVVNPDRTFGARPVTLSVTLDPPGSVASAARTDVVDGGSPETP